MVLFKRSKKSLVAMFSGFSNPAYLLAAFFALAAAAQAETGVVSAVGTGRDSGDAISNLLKTTMGKYFKSQPPRYITSVLQGEILPNASSFLQSYKMLEGSRAGMVQLSASIDLDVLSGLLNLTPKNLGEENLTKALVVVRAPKLPDSAVAGMKPPVNGAKAVDPFSPLATGARERLSRRDFSDVTLTAEELSAVGAGEDISSPELLRGLGSKAGARLAFGISGRFETYENENSHNKDERLVLTATLVDVKLGIVLGRTNVNVVNPKSRREQYISELQRNISEESKDLFQDVLVSAGRKIGKQEGPDGLSVVRVQFPSNNGLVMKFKSLLEGVPGVRSVTEYSIRRGKFDLAIRPALAEANLVKAVSSMRSPDIQISLIEAVASSDLPSPVVTVKLAPKEESQGDEGGVQNAKE
jgi:hypothetical protein